MMRGSFSNKMYSIFSSVLYLPREKRMIPWIAVCGTPIALRTWEGSGFLEAQAEPAEAAIASLARETVAARKVTIEEYQ
jgi:hypothetical protein